MSRRPSNDVVRADAPRTDAAATSGVAGGAAQPGVTLRRRPSVTAVVWLAVVWVLLWGDLTIANVLAGLMVALAVAWFLPLPRVPFAGRPSGFGLVRLFGRLAGDIVVASVHVAAVALRFGHEPRGGVLRVRLRSRSDLYLTLTADLCSLVPGSIIVEAHRATGTLYVHTLDLSGPGAVEHARTVVLDQEARVLYALASDEEIAAAGLPPRRFGGPSRARGGAAVASRAVPDQGAPGSGRSGSSSGSSAVSGAGDRGTRSRRRDEGGDAR
ncbi:MAG TPA: Na+/H+ antiporter subunit E [Micrococcales bacterium]|uniref:Na+/H+ antiporter subunit E n=1 Tax=Miniimonas arenae TaxID=676201 RepID=A0A5C5BD28_9MICO|nr:Na+/H+ antiporter subunit E [Miniimonas arenae]TNU75023.1 Na+/H+ antiporter subunit E [Miniimonas arenae]HCX83991.1 Na+/H+ antiporter subunit E [Micrococcales bacterium]